ncbi:MAG: bifunctional (p)ppGpp synthetase/guanosine-3',5'-bis(diphosphate) 3'-pyrophosphohydrolase [Candidatus Tectomicrobia bacterium]|nr:bifunctional (p)ppGpp synthetase/guanosine-3',5'-bis(diphosphate) 3'-pyrophosphohydrolase [Candidatus Tectomicrobia bacterium]
MQSVASVSGTSQLEVNEEPSDKSSTPGIEEIIQEVLSYSSAPTIDLIQKAYLFAADVHEGQKRRSGGPYLSHPLEVASILTQLRMDPVTIAAALLHDTVEDITRVTIEEIAEKFGGEVALLVDGVTKMDRMNFSSSEEQEAENFRKILLAMAKDIRVVLIKLADRLHNMRTLQYMTATSQVKKARETLDIYAPLANRLGIGWIKEELEDLAFRYLDPATYRELDLKITSGNDRREAYINEVKEIISKALKEADLPGTVTGRPKQIYSIYRKMQRQNVGFDEVYDIIALRITAKTVKDCYGILGIIHSLWRPIPGRFKDYIALPKQNLYQSLHTTVIGPKGHRVEFQIRTEEMHKIAEDGIAAHWGYKEGGKTDEDDIKKFAWLRHILDWQQELKDPKEFLETLKIDLFPEEVYVFTPKGDVKAFPRGATPIDFAYSIHTDVGNQCVGAKVNGKIVRLNYELKNGDIIQIFTSANHTPSRDWLKIVKTPRARAKIRAWIKKEQKDSSILLGRELLEKEVQKYGLTLSTFLKTGGLEEVARRFGFLTADDLLAGIGYNKVSTQQLVTKLIPEELLRERKGSEEPKESEGRREPKDNGSTGIKIQGIGNILVHFAKCCNPVPGDDIIGFITRGRGVSIHTFDCLSIRDLDIDRERQIDVEWDLKANGTHPVKISVLTNDRKGVLAEISAAIASCDANISQANVQVREDKKATMDFVVDVTNLAHLQQVIRTVQQNRSVIKVERRKDYSVLGRKARKKLDL